MRDLVPEPPKKTPHQLRRLLSQNPFSDFWMVVPSRLRRNVDDGPTGAKFGVSGAEDNTGDAGQVYGPDTHRAGLQANKEGAIVQAPTFKGRRGGRQGQHLGVGGGIPQRFDAVVAPADDPLVVDDHAADRHLVDQHGGLRLFEGLAHPMLVSVVFRYHDCIEILMSGNVQ